MKRKCSNFQRNTFENKQILIDTDFVHLHNHTQFSVLQSTVSVKDLVAAAVKNKMPAVAMTDMGNMMGAFHFVRDILNHNKSAEAKIKKLLKLAKHQPKPL